MENDKPLILIHSQMKYLSDTSSEGVNIMLTPQFYTIKRESLPVQYAYQAKRIAPSLFEGLLENTQDYTYFVQKEEDDWLFIAYDIEKIKSFLISKGLALTNISKMYFAEQSAAQFKAPVLLGDNNALVNLNSTMTVIPKKVLQADEKPMKIDKSFTPKKGLALEGRSKALIGNTETYTLATILVLFSVIYFVEGSRYGGEDAEQEAQMQLLLEDYPSLQSSYKRESIASKYKVIDKKERKKRDVIKSLSHMIFKGSTLTSLVLDDKSFQANFACKDAKTSKKLKDLAKKEKFNISQIHKSHDVKIEGKL